MKTELEYFDIYPKVVRAHSSAVINIRSLGDQAAFTAPEYEVTAVPMEETNKHTGSAYPTYAASPKGGALRVEIPFGGEQLYALILRAGGAEAARLYVYALAEDWYGLRPYQGDMHVHTCRSDGKESPAVVAANYRRAGYDFLAVTDHLQYAPSLEAVAAFMDSGADLALFPGEEIHPPGNHTHIVNFGGDFSVNEWIREHPAQYEAAVQALAEELAVPDGVEPAEYASLVWSFRKIREGGGLAILPHPSWISFDAYHISTALYRHLLRTRSFDALELTCGQTPQENQIQVAAWQQARAEGLDIPIVGSSDSHGTVNSEYFGMSKMLVFSRSCTRRELIDNVKGHRCAVVEQYPGDPVPRLYGSLRAVSLAQFLLNEYLPLHHALCFEEGRLMKDYACGDASAAEGLRRLSGRCGRLAEKYLP